MAFRPQHTIAGTARDTRLTVDELRDRLAELPGWYPVDAIGLSQVVDRGERTVVFIRPGDS